jgi:hypothetical protein
MIPQGRWWRWLSRLTTSRRDHVHGFGAALIANLVSRGLATLTHEKVRAAASWSMSAKLGSRKPGAILSQPKIDAPPVERSSFHEGAGMTSPGSVKLIDSTLVILPEAVLVATDLIRRPLHRLVNGFPIAEIVLLSFRQWRFLMPVRLSPYRSRVC